MPAAEGERVAVLTALREAAWWGLTVAGYVPQALPLPEGAVG